MAETMETSSAMARYKYLIIGGGMAAAAAVRGIRDVDGSSSIGMITAEPMRPQDLRGRITN